MWLALNRTRIGMIVRAGVDDRDILAAMGVRIQLVFVLVFALGAGLAGMAGVVGATFQSISPGEDIRFLLASLVVVIIGGMGSIPGAALGAADRRPRRAARLGLHSDLRDRGDVSDHGARAGRSAAGPAGGPLAMSITQDARLQPDNLAAATPLSGLARADFGHPAAWVVAFILIIMPLIANGFFLIEIFGTTLILGIVALSLMFLAGYGGMVSLMQLTIAGLAGYMTAVLGASGNANISLGWPWWLATPMALALATLFGTIGGALAVRTEGIYTIMITLAIASAFYYFTNQNWVIFNGHTGINSVVTPHFWGVDWRADIPFYYVILVVAALCFGAVSYLSRAPFGLALQGVRDNPRRMAALGFNVNAHRVAAYAFASFRGRARRRLAGLELPADLAGVGRRRAGDRHSHHRRRRRHHATDRSIHRRPDLCPAAHLHAGFSGGDRARRQSLPPVDRSRLSGHRAVLPGRHRRALGTLARPGPAGQTQPGGDRHG